MSKSLLAPAFLFIVAVGVFGTEKEIHILHAPVYIPLPTPAVASASSLPPGDPVRLIIPSIGLNDSVIGVGTTSEGDMAVPSGDTREVGWYKFGTVPGEVGSAVIDAHVFAAFSNLRDLKVGEDIYILTDKKNQKLHFVVRDVETYALADVPAAALFNQADTERLNLITCAGTLTSDRSTYTERLVVYATLASL